MSRYLELLKQQLKNPKKWLMIIVMVGVIILTIYVFKATKYTARKCPPGSKIRKGCGQQCIVENPCPASYEFTCTETTHSCVCDHKSFEQCPDPNKPCCPKGHCVDNPMKKGEKICCDVDKLCTDGTCCDEPNKICMHKGNTNTTTCTAVCGNINNKIVCDPDTEECMTVLFDKIKFPKISDRKSMFENFKNDMCNELPTSKKRACQDPDSSAVFHNDEYTEGYTCAPIQKCEFTDPNYIPARVDSIDVFTNLYGSLNTTGGSVGYCGFGPVGTKMTPGDVSLHCIEKTTVGYKAGDCGNGRDGCKWRDVVGAAAKDMDDINKDLQEQQDSPINGLGYYCKDTLSREKQRVMYSTTKKGSTKKCTAYDCWSSYNKFGGNIKWNPETGTCTALQEDNLTTCPSKCPADEKNFRCSDKQIIPYIPPPDGPCAHKTNCEDSVDSITKDTSWCIPTLGPVSQGHCTKVGVGCKPGFVYAGEDKGMCTMGKCSTGQTKTGDDSYECSIFSGKLSTQSTDPLQVWFINDTPYPMIVQRVSVSSAVNNMNNHMWLVLEYEPYGKNEAFGIDRNWRYSYSQYHIEKFDVTWTFPDGSTAGYHIHVITDNNSSNGLKCMNGLQVGGHQVNHVSTNDSDTSGVTPYLSSRVRLDSNNQTVVWGAANMIVTLTMWDVKKDHPER